MFPLTYLYLNGFAKKILSLAYLYLNGFAKKILSLAVKNTQASLVCFRSLICILMASPRRYFRSL